MDPKRRSRTEQLHLYKPQQAKTIRQSFEYAFHLRNLTQHLRLGGFLLFQLYHRRQASGLFCRYPYRTATLTTERCGRLWKQFPPTPLCILQTLETIDPSGSTPYHQSPPYTALGYKDNEGQYLNKNLKVHAGLLKAASVWTGTCKTGSWFLQKVSSSVTAVCHFPSKTTFRWHAKETITVSPATKHSSLQPAQGVRTGNHVPLAGIRQVQSRILLHLIPLEYRNRSNGDFIPSAWDNRFILNMSGTYNLPRRWSIGGKLSYIGGILHPPMMKTNHHCRSMGCQRTALLRLCVL